MFKTKTSFLAIIIAAASGAHGQQLKAASVSMELGHIHVGIQNIPLALQWFDKVLQLKPTFLNERLAIVPSKPIHIILDATDEDAPVTIAFASENVDADHQRLVERGATSLEVPNDKPYGVRAAYLKGPGALKFEIEGPLSSVKTGQAKENPMSTSIKHDRAISKEILVSASLNDVWEAWTTSKGAMTFFAPKAIIGSAVGEPYEIYFDPADERQGTKGLKILSYLPKETVSFEWNAPPDLPNVRKIPTQVAIKLSQASPDQVKVELMHTGWREGAEWDRALKYFTRAWNIVLTRLSQRFAKGPIDWTSLN